MPNIKITVAGKIATNTTPDVVIVCGNSDYTVTFDLDAEWAAEATRTARFTYIRDGRTRYKEKTFQGDTVAVPKLSGIRQVTVGLYAGTPDDPGDLRTTTAAAVWCKPSILCGDAAEEITPAEKAGLQSQVDELRRDVDDLKENGTGGNATGGNCSQNTTQKEVVETVTVGADPVVLDGSAPEQVANLVWAVEAAKTVPAFANYYIAKSGMTYPRAFDTAQYVQFFSTSYHGNEAAFVARHTYFHAMKYRMDGDSTATLQGGAFQTPTGSNIISGSGWAYGVSEPVAPASSSFIMKNTATGTGVIEYVYCIDITALNEAGTTTPTALTALAELFGELPLVPGQDYPGGAIGDGTATLSITRGGEVITVNNSASTATVKGGDTLSAVGGSVTFLLSVLKTVPVDNARQWEGVTVAFVGDSLTDPSINADKKYHSYIAEATGINAVVLGKGGTGYWRGYESGDAYGQRIASVPANADIITIFGSVNDWRTKNAGVEIGTASDTIEAGTLAGYINGAIDTAQAAAPYAQIALITPLDYHGIPDDIMESIANIIMAVAKRRKIKCLDLYHESGFRVDDPTFAAAYCTDYSATVDTYGHPSNMAHEKIIAPEFMQLLRRMIL